MTMIATEDVPEIGKINEKEEEKKKSINPIAEMLSVSIHVCRNF